MNKVITINLNGLAYQLEESGYETLRNYLDLAGRRLEGNPDRDEIIADIEQAIADKFRALLGVHKTVVAAKEVEAVIAEMGPVQDGAEATEGAAAAGRGPGSAAGGGETAAEGKDPAGAGRPVGRRLFKIMDGAKIFGVCNGLAAYFDVDVTLVRVAFAFSAFMWGSGLLLYLIMALILPSAVTPEEKTAAFGGPSTAEEFIRRAKAGYYEGMRTFHDRRAHREWRRKFRQEMRGWKYNFHWRINPPAGPGRPEWTPGPIPVGLALAWPVSIALQLVIFVLICFAVLSLLSHGSVLGVVMPKDIPVWIGVVFLLVVYRALTLPLRGWRYMALWHAGRGFGYRTHPGGFFDTVVWLAFLVAAVWLADHYVPAVHDALQNLPPALHRAVDAVNDWWSKR